MMQSPTRSRAIPAPLKLPVIKHLLHIDRDKPVQSIHEMVRDQGPIFRLEFPGKSFVVLASHDLIDEACDTTRFVKAVPAPLVRLRELAGDGLFTAYNEEENWGKAHRILMPAFSGAAMRGYHDMMLDVGLQMVDRWARLRSDEIVDVPDDMTRLTLDVIALCGFDYRFNSFYREEMHPFVDSMVSALELSMKADDRPNLINQLRFKERQQFVTDVRSMHDLVSELITERKHRGGTDGARDLLGLMLDARDPTTGEKLDDENIRNQIVTFLIAGHETTSSLLSFALYYLLENPTVWREVVDEVDRVIGDASNLPTFEDLRELHALERVLFETLRLWPPAPGFVLTPREPTLLGGQWETVPGDELLVLLSSLHRDTRVWGPNPNRFDPDRFLPEAVAARPANAWKPFGNGARACIGRQFALQEAKLTLALMLQRFEFKKVDPNYTLDVRETLTFKPQGFQVIPKLRKGCDTRSIFARGVTRQDEHNHEPETSTTNHAITPNGAKVLVGFGSNMGTTEQIAADFARRAGAYGYEVELLNLDACVTRDLSSYDLFAVFSASYNGFPPDNAVAFCDWLDALAPDALADTQHIIFGCGHRDWAATFQAVPARISDAMIAAGSRAISPRAEGDARDDLDEQFDSWLGGSWETIHAACGVTDQVDARSGTEPRTTLTVELLDQPAGEHIPSDLVPMKVTARRDLVEMSDALARQKVHIEIALPESASYAPGDYLVVMPANDDAYVSALARRCGWGLDRVIILRSEHHTTLPTDRALSVRALLSRHLELKQPLTHRKLSKLLAHIECPPEKMRLTALLEDEDRFEEEVRSKKLRLLDVLTMFPSCQLSLEAVIDLLPPLAPRTYSIASAPERSPRHVDLTVSVIDQPALSGLGRYAGCASGYLEGLAAEDSLLAAVRPADPRFKPAPDTTPMLMICAGTGLAPFRGFIQQRAARANDGVEVAPMALFFGCDREDVDFLYRDELERVAQDAQLEIFPAFSRGDDPEIKFVQHKLAASAEKVWELIDAGATIYVCGDGRYMAPAVRDALIAIYEERQGEESGRAWLDDLIRAGRFVEDVWSS